MKKIALILVAILLPCWQAKSQETEATSKEGFIDLSVSPLTLEWVNPENDNYISGSNSLLARVGIIANQELSKAEFTNNGVPVDNSRGFKISNRKKEENKFDQLIEQEIDLIEGKNVIKLTVSDSENNVQFIERAVFWQDDTKDLIRTDYALLFATDTYDEWSELVNPINDAKTIARELEGSYGFKVEIVESPTQDEVILKLREYAEKSYLDYDQLFIFFAGHGQFDDVLGQGYIVTKDSKRIDNAKTSYISHSVIRNVIDNIPSQHTFLAMDVCFAGTFDPTIAREGNRGESDLYNELSTTEFIRRKLRFKTRKYITSGGKQYVPDGVAGRHSPFARKFLEALRDYGGRDKVLTLNELSGWLERINPEPRAGSFGTDEPGSDFVFVVKL